MMTQVTQISKTSGGDLNLPGQIFSRGHVHHKTIAVSAQKTLWRARQLATFRFGAPWAHPRTRPYKVARGIAQHARRRLPRQARLAGRTEHMLDRLSSNAHAYGSTSCHAVAARFRASEQPSTAPMAARACFSMRGHVDFERLLGTEPTARPQPLAQTQRGRSRRSTRSRIMICRHGEHKR